MNKLEELLSICDKNERLSELIAYARSLAIDVKRVRDTQGEYNEERLIILIFDAEHKIIRVDKKHFYILSGLGVILIGLVILTFLCIKIVGYFSDPNHSIKPHRPDAKSSLK